MNATSCYRENYRVIYSLFFFTSPIWRLKWWQSIQKVAFYWPYFYGRWNFHKIIFIPFVFLTIIKTFSYFFPQKLLLAFTSFLIFRSLFFCLSSCFSTVRFQRRSHDNWNNLKIVMKIYSSGNSSQENCCNFFMESQGTCALILSKDDSSMTAVAIFWEYFSIFSVSYEFLRLVEMNFWRILKIFNLSFASRLM